MKALKKLTGETAIYGMPSIIGRFLNWWLNPYWTYVFLEQADLGRITNIYAYVAFVFVLLTYGMETGFFRFASRENENKVFSTSIISITSTAILFLLFIIGWKDNIANAMELSGYSNFILIMAITVVFDVISTIPFAKLRLEHKPMRFAFVKFVNIGINIGFNLFFLSLLPWLAKQFPSSWIASVYRPAFGIGYVFLSNLIASVITFFLLIPQVKLTWDFDFGLLKRMLNYAFPILIVGLTGMINQNIDKILIPKLLPEEMMPMKQLGIYAASFKMAVILNMFIQAFRYAFEPFFFSQNDQKETKEMYVVVMKYFTILGLIIFLGLSTFIDIFKHIVAEQYREGIGIVPIVLMANLFMGIYFTLSLWYKLTDKTRFGAYMGILGSVVTIIINIALIPVLGYYASAIAILSCFVVMTVTSYFLGNKYYPLKYDLKNFFTYLIISLVLFGVYWMIRTPESPKYGLAVVVNLLFIGTIFIREQKAFRLLFKAEK